MKADNMKKIYGIFLLASIAFSGAGATWAIVVYVDHDQKMASYNAVLGMHASQPPGSSGLTPSFVSVYNDDVNASCNVTVSTGGKLMMHQTYAIVNKTYLVYDEDWYMTSDGETDGNRSNPHNITGQFITEIDHYTYSIEGHDTVTKEIKPGEGLFMFFYGTREYSWSWNFSSTNDTAIGYMAWRMYQGSNDNMESGFDVQRNRSGAGSRFFTAANAAHQYVINVNRSRGYAHENDISLDVSSAYVPAMFLLGIGAG
nr:hypothetical protein [Candidatus Sigynarchaeota archaeon]